MNLKIDFTKNFLPHLIAILVFALVNVFVYNPIFFENKEISQHDINQGRYGAHEATEFYKETGGHTLWTNSMFSGMPAYLVRLSFDHENILYQVEKAFTLYLPRLTAGYTFRAMLCFYILLLVFGVNPYLAIGGALGYGLGTFNIISIIAGHGWKVSAIGYMPLVLAGMRLVYKSKFLMGFALTSFAFMMELHANHPQITYYLAFILFFYGLHELILAIKSSEIKLFSKKSSIAIAALTLGLLANAGKTWLISEYSPYSIRGATELTSDDHGKTSSGLDRDYAFAWSSGISESLTFIIPYFNGGASGQALKSSSYFAKELKKKGVNTSQIKSFIKAVPTYWGKQPFTAGPIYMGITIFFLLIIAIIKLKKEFYWWMIAAGCLGIMLSWGNNFKVFNYLMFDYFPAYSKFRTPAMAVVIPLLCFPLAAFVGFQEFLNGIQKDSLKTSKMMLIKSTIITVSILLIIYIASFFMSFEGLVDARYAGQEWLVDIIRAQRRILIQTDFARGLALVIAVFICAYAALIKKVSFQIAASIISLLIFIDFISVNSRYLKESNFSKTKKKQTLVISPSQADQSILNDKALSYRVLNLQNPFNEAKTSYFHKSIGGYHGAKMRRYQDLIDSYLTNDINYIVNNLKAGKKDFSKAQTLNMLNAKYIKFGDTKNEVVVNRSAFGNAWFVNNIVKVNSPDEEIEALGKHDLSKTAIMDQSKFNLEKDHFEGEGQISLVTYRPNYLKYSVSNAGNSLIVLSEIFYPKGWTATIDGQQADIIRLNYVLRGLNIKSSGDHIVEFSFKPKSYDIANMIMTISVIAIFIAMAASLYFDFLKKA